MQVECSDGTTTAVDVSTVAELVRAAQQLGLEPAALDDWVHDCCDATASRRVNNDHGLADDIEDAQDVAYGDASRIGSRVNNAGLTSQLAFLAAELGADEVARSLPTLPH